MGQLLYIHRPRPGAPDPQGHTFGELLAYHVAEVLPTKAPNTQYQQTRFLHRLEREFGHLPLDAITPGWLREWRDQLRRQVTQGRIVSLWDQQAMARKERAAIEEGERNFILENNLARSLAPNHFAKLAIGIEVKSDIRLRHTSNPKSSDE